MRNLLSALLILCSLAVIGLPQQKKTLASDGDIRISKDQPTIYITFVRSGKREPVHNSESKEGVIITNGKNGRDMLRWVVVSRNIASISMEAMFPKVHINEGGDV